MFPDEKRLRLDFLPYFERTIQEYGIAFEGLNCRYDTLRRFIHAKDPESQKKKRVFICRYDTRDLQTTWRQYGSGTPESRGLGWFDAGYGGINVRLALLFPAVC